MLAPIVLFVYNRPDHTQKVIDALKNNPEAKDSELFVYCDGAKENASEIEKKQIEETRKIIRAIIGFKSVTMIESKENKGLAFSIIEGVTEIVNKHGRIIVLEDDIVTSSGFLKFMNDALEVYSKVKKVMHISGYVFPYQDTEERYTFFSKPTTCWGWATWKESWSYFEKNANEQIHKLEIGNYWDEFTLNNTIPSYKNQLHQNKNGEINTWAIFWYASVFLMNGTSLHPSISLVNNIGLDGSGENSGQWNSNNPFYWPKVAENIPVEKKCSYSSKAENMKLRNAFREKILGNYFKEKKHSIRDKFYLLRKKFFN